MRLSCVRLSPRRSIPALACALALALLPKISSPARSSGPPLDVLISATTGAEASVARAVRAVGGHISHRLSVIDGFSARIPAGAVPRLSLEPGVRWVAPNRALHTVGQYGQDSNVASAVYTDVTRASKAWGMNDTGAGINVALVDTGVYTGGDLGNRVIHAEDFTAEQDNHDNYGHGTFVAGLIAGTGANSGGAIKGMAPNAGLVSLKIAGRDGTTDVTRVLEALEWIVTFKDTYSIRVVNLSLGTDSRQSYAIDPLDFAIERVWNDGLVVVAAAGNTGPGTGVLKPGDDPLVITVGSTNDHTTTTITDDNVATFSSSGLTVDGFAKPDLVASGRSIVSSRSPGSAIDVANPTAAIGDTYAKGSGTSFSTGIVSGAAALILARNPLLNPNQVKQRLTATARTLGSNAAAGHGQLDAFGAAFSLDLTEANHWVPPAVGGGSLQASRGSFCVRYDDLSCMSDADADAYLGFDSATYFSNTWAGSQWAGSQWAGSQWAGSQWTGSQWAGSQWAGSQWAGSQWAGSQWAGSQWAGSQWAGWEGY